MSIVRLLADAGKAIGAVGKGSRNTSQNYSFRGIDDVINAVGPVFQELGIVCTPEVIRSKSYPVTSSQGSSGWRTVMLVEFKFHGPEDSISAIVQGEAIDYGDKSSNKAMSAAHKYALTQTLSLPTNDKDADSDSHELRPSRSATSSSQGVDRLLITRVEEGDGFLKLCPSCSDPLDDRRATFVPGGKDPAWKCPNRDCQGGSPKKNGQGNWSWASWNPNEFDDSPQTRWAKNTLWGLVIQDRQKALEAAAVGPDIDDVSLGRAFFLECLNISGQVEPLSEGGAKAVVEAAEQIIPPKEPDPQRPF